MILFIIRRINDLLLFPKGIYTLQLKKKSNKKNFFDYKHKAAYLKTPKGHEIVSTLKIPIC